MNAGDFSSGSRNALFARIVERTQSQLYGFVRGLIHDSENARDVVQDVYVDAWRATQNEKPPFVPARDDVEVRKWLFHAAYCKAISYLRHRHAINWESLDTLPIPASAEYDMSAFETRVIDAESVRAALAQLETADSLCLTLSVIQGFTSAEIAQILDITPEATRKRLSRAMQRLRVAFLAQESALKPVVEPPPSVHVTDREGRAWV